MNRRRVRLSVILFYVSFFFFQAEDGIRDGTVTVQTCALPIYVRFANEFISETIRKDPRAALRVAKALTLASTAFLEVMGREAIEKVAYLTDEKGRLEAGFGLAEVKAATTQAIKRRASYESH